MDCTTDGTNGKVGPASTRHDVGFFCISSAPPLGSFVDCCLSQHQPVLSHLLVLLVSVRKPHVAGIAAMGEIRILCTGPLAIG